MTGWFSHAGAVFSLVHSTTFNIMQNKTYTPLLISHFIPASSGNSFWITWSPATPAVSGIGYYRLGYLWSNKSWPNVTQSSCDPCFPFHCTMYQEQFRLFFFLQDLEWYGWRWVVVWWWSLAAGRLKLTNIHLCFIFFTQIPVLTKSLPFNIFYFLLHHRVTPFTLPADITAPYTLSNPIMPSLSLPIVP